MKISPKQYAQALYESLKDRSRKQQKIIIAEFIELLRKNNNIAMEKNIIGEFEKYWNKKEQIVNLEIESAKDLDASTVTNIKKYIENQSGAKKIECKKQINKDILGGVILRYEDKILDLSLKSKIEKLKNTIKK